MPSQHSQVRAPTPYDTATLTGCSPLSGEGIPAPWGEGQLGKQIGVLTSEPPGPDQGTARAEERVEGRLLGLSVESILHKPDIPKPHCTADLQAEAVTIHGVDPQDTLQSRQAQAVPTQTSFRERAGSVQGDRLTTSPRPCWKPSSACKSRTLPKG